MKKVIAFIQLPFVLIALLLLDFAILFLVACGKTPQAEAIRVTLSLIADSFKPATAQPKPALPRIEEKVFPPPPPEEEISITKPVAPTQILSANSLDEVFNHPAPKAATDLLERSGPDLRKAIEASLQSPPNGVAEPARKPERQVAKPAPGIASKVSVEKIDPNANTAIVHRDQIVPPAAKAVPREDLLKLQAEMIAQDMPEGDTFAEGPHIDPKPTAAKGVDVVAAAEAEIAAVREVTRVLSNPERMIRSGGADIEAWKLHAGCAHALFAAALGSQESERYRASIDPIPASEQKWSERFSVVFLTDPVLLTPFKALQCAGIKYNGNLPDNPAKKHAYWSYGQPGSTYLGLNPAEVMEGLVGKDEKPLTVFEVACLLIQYPWAIPMTPGSGIDCVGEDGKTYTIYRRSDGMLQLEEGEPYNYDEKIGMATRGSITGVIDLNVH